MASRFQKRLQGLTKRFAKKLQGFKKGFRASKSLIKASENDLRW